MEATNIFIYCHNNSTTEGNILLIAAKQEPTDGCRMSMKSKIKQLFAALYYKSKTFSNPV